MAYDEFQCLPAETQNRIVELLSRAYGRLKKGFFESHDREQQQGQSSSPGDIVLDIEQLREQQRPHIDPDNQPLLADTSQEELDNSLYWASFSGRANEVRSMIASGANVNASTNHLYRFPLLIASCRGYKEIVQILLEKGADVNAKSSYDSTALRIAVLKGHGAVVQLLLDRGADVNAQDDHLNSALMTASRWGRIETVQLLLTRGANVTIRNRSNRSAIDVARAAGHADIVQLLESHGAED